jgi:hypothetical protein
MPSSPTGYKHTLNEGAWVYCSRCADKVKAKDCMWQRGLFLCSPCFDDPSMLIGVREFKINQVLTDGKVEFDLDEKLKHPEISNDDGDILL